MSGRQGIDKLIQKGVRRIAEQSRRLCVRHPVRTGRPEQLVKNGEGIANRPGARPNDQPDDAGLNLDPFLLADSGQIIRQEARWDESERIVVGPASDRPDDLVRLGCRENELDMRGRLLDQFEQGIETGRRHHVGLIDDVDLVARVDRREECPLAEVPGVVNPAV
jgi:hypothetical protein